MNSPHADAIAAFALKPEEKVTIAAFLSDKTRGKPDRKDRRRAARRFRFLDPAGLIIRVIHPGGTTAPFRIIPRDLSELGMGFLHGNFLYPGSRCGLDLRGSDGDIRRVIAKIVRCEHITGRVHEVGVEFDEPVDPALYMDMEALPDDRTDATAPAKPSYWKTT